MNHVRFVAGDKSEESTYYGVAMKEAQPWCRMSKDAGTMMGCRLSGGEAGGGALSPLIRSHTSAPLPKHSNYNFKKNLGAAIKDHFCFDLSVTGNLFIVK